MICKRTGYLISVVAAIGALHLFTSCRRDPDVVKDIRFEIPANFPAPKYNFSSNPVTTAGFELGRKLFYETRLSRDNSTSCGSCHSSYSAFTHHGHSLSHGIDNKLGTRNAPPVMNLAWYDEFMWDGGINKLDMLPIAPIENPVEMDLEFAIAVQRIKSYEEYGPLFKAAFGSSEVTGPKLLQALSQFMNMLISADSKYDKWKRGESGVTLSADEKEGMLLFQQKCSACHSTDLFTDNKFHNNGIYSSFPTDSGRAHITELPQDVGKFKTPSLRNLKYTYPYMHDGSIATLNQVLDHYSSGVKASPTLDTLLKKNGVLGIPLSTDEKQKIISFLNTLNDDNFVKDRRFAEQ